MNRETTTMDEARRQAGPDAHIVGVIDHPVAHSLSPLLHEAAFAELGLHGRWRSFAFAVPEGQAADALDALRRNDLTGVSVTMPHKAAVAGLVDECSDVAGRLEAVNCVVNRGGALWGTNTDGEGFVASLRRGAGFEPAGRCCLVVGAGGAARAVILALATAGAARVDVANRTPERARAAAALAGASGSVVDLAEAGSLVAVVAAADLVVNATPVGMAGTSGASREGAWLVDPGLLRPGQVAVDLVYAPRRTPWLEAAASQGATALGGLGMLVHQAAAQISLWTGSEAPIEAMWRAADAADLTT